MRRLRYLLVAVAACFALAACGDDPTADVEAIEQDLAREVETATGTRNVAVDCANDLTEGDICKVSAAGGVRAEVRVTRLEDDGDVEGELVQP